MTVDLSDLADGLRWLLVLAGIFWIAYAWLRRIDYRRAVLVLAGLVVVDVLAHALAGWAERPDSNIPTDFSIYSLVILAAAGAGLGAAYLCTRGTGIKLALLLDATLIVVVLGAIGARAYHIAAHWDYYSQNTDNIANLGQGGMGFIGALVFGVIALLVFAWIRRVSFWELADVGAVGLALAMSIGWYGAYIVGANYGVVSDAALVLPGGSLVSIAQDLPDVYGIVEPRLPVQLFAVLFFFVLLTVLAWMSRRWQVGQGIVFLSFLIVSSLGGFALGFMRADETFIWNGWRIDQWMDIILAGIGLAALGARAYILSTSLSLAAKGGE